MKKITALFCVLLLIACGTAEKKPANDKLRQSLQTLVQPFKAVVGVSVIHIEDGDTLTLNNDLSFPMQSVYKFPLAIAVLHQVDEKKYALDQKIHVTKDDLHPNTWSPLAELYPEGNVAIPLADLLRYTVSQSDNNTCDILFKLLGGTKPVEDYVHQLGYTKMNIRATEVDLHTKGDSAAQSNGCYPSEMSRLLTDFYAGKHLTQTSHTFLMKLMVESENGPKRIKGLLPERTIVAHKTGTGDRIVNDVGIITLPNGKHIALTVFVQQSDETFEDAEALIAQISKAVYDYYSTSSK